MAQSLNELLAEIESEFPDFQIVNKSDSNFMKLLDVGLRIVTLNKMNEFMTRFTTTVGYTVYVTDEWEHRSQMDRVEVLRHERVHMRQRQKLGFFVFMVMYLLLPLPLFFAHFRKKFEQEAYMESMRCEAERAGSAIPLMQKKYRDAMIERFTGPSYGWMWVRRGDIENWYDDAVDTILADLKK